MVARVVAAVLGTIAVWLTYLAGARFFNRNVGAARGGDASGSRSCRSSTATSRSTTCRRWRPVALSLYGIAGVMRRGRLRDYVIAGVGIGLAAATKYTGGITLLCLLAAFVCDAAGGSLARGRAAPALRARCVALLAFVIANPYSVLDFSSFSAGVTAAGVAGRRPGPGQARDDCRAAASRYYLWTFTWGLGWGPTLAALGGRGRC